MAVLKKLKQLGKKPFCLFPVLPCCLECVCNGRSSSSTLGLRYNLSVVALRGKGERSKGSESLIDFR